MKFYCNVNSVECRQTENNKYYILNKSENGGGIIAFVPRKNEDVLTDILLSDEWKGQVFEIEYYTYKSKQGDYKSCFRIVDILPCFPLGD